MLHPVAENGDDDFNRFETRWATVRLAIIVAGVLGGIALMIPIAMILADKDTRVTVSAVLSFSAVATLSTAMTGAGWWTSARARRRLTRKVDTLESENRQLRETVARLEQAQPPLTDISGIEGDDS